MAPRAYWKGYLKLSLVSCPIALYPASSEREKISFHQINKTTGNRIKYRKVDTETGDEVAADDIIIIEGVPALLIEPLRALAQVTVHLEVPETERVARLKADYRWRGYSEQSIDELMTLRAKDENVTVNAVRELADYAISSESER